MVANNAFSLITQLLCANLYTASSLVLRPPPSVHLENSIVVKLYYCSVAQSISHKYVVTQDCTQINATFLIQLNIAWRWTWPDCVALSWSGDSLQAYATWLYKTVPPHSEQKTLNVWSTRFFAKTRDFCWLICEQDAKKRQRLLKSHNNTTMTLTDIITFQVIAHLFGIFIYLWAFFIQ